MMLRDGEDNAATGVRQYTDTHTHTHARRRLIHRRVGGSSEGGGCREPPAAPVVAVRVAGGLTDPRVCARIYSAP